jgi:hypothetical protein
MKVFFKKKDLISALRLVQNRNPKLAAFNPMTPQRIPQAARRGLKLDGIVFDDRQDAAFEAWRKGKK